MSDVFTITLPSSVSENEVEAIEQALKQIESVEDAGSVTTRQLDPATITIWIGVAGAILGVASKGTTIIQRVVEIFRGKGISGAKIKLPNGAEIAVDNASASEIERLMHAAK